MLKGTTAAVETAIKAGKTFDQMKADDVLGPNGLCFSPDERLLYVVEQAGKALTLCFLCALPEDEAPDERPGVRFAPVSGNESEFEPPIDVDQAIVVSANVDDDAYTLIQRQQQPVYAARVELNLAESSSKSGLMADLKSRFIGLQLESGGRISIKRKNGGAMVYYRTAF